MKSKLFTLYWSLVVLFIPFFALDTTQNARDYKDIIFIFAGIVSLGLFGFKPKLIIVLVLAWFFLGISTHQGFTSRESEVFQSLCFIIGLCLVSQFATFKANLINILSIAAIIQSAWVISQYLGYEPMLWVYSVRGLNGYGSVAGSLCNTMVTGAYLGAITPTLFRKKWLIFAPFAIASLYLLGSAMGWFSAIAGCAYLVVVSIKRYKLIILCTASLISASVLAWIGFATNFLNASGRYQAWVEAIKKVGLTANGAGLGYFKDVLYKDIKAIYMLRHAHNEYVQAYVSFGFLGFLILSVAFILIFRHHRKEPYCSACIIGTLAASFGSFPLYISSSALTFIVCIGALLSHCSLDIVSLYGKLIKLKQESIV